jgi:uncharacterized lipoprotein
MAELRLVSSTSHTEKPPTKMKRESMKSVQLYASALLVSTVMLISACSSSSKTEETPAPAAAPAAPAAAPAATPSGSSATVGKKLIDLNQAREAGAITDEEYEVAKKKLLDSQ